MVSKENAGDVEAVLSRRHDNGADYWTTEDGRILVGDPYSTITSLLVLHELRLPKTHEAVKGAIDLIFAALRPDGRFRIAPKGAMYPCHTALIAAILGRFGLGDDRRLEQTFKYLSNGQNEDGGWRCNTVPVGRSLDTDCSNPGVTLFVLDAMRFMQQPSTQLVASAIDSLLGHWQVKRPLGPCTFGIGTQFMQVEYPFLRYNLFYYVYVLSFFKVARADPRFRSAFELLQTKLDKRNRVIVERPHRRLGKDLAFCRKGHPSKLATSRHREILKNLESD